ncbi:MAG: hypothetical protein V1754_13045 [Pseudomonadota bacterium]
MRISQVCVVWISLFAAVFSEAKEEQRVILMPIELVNASPEQGVRYQKLFLEAITQVPTIVAVETKKAVATVEALPKTCTKEEDCLLRLGKKLGVQKLLALRVGKLGETVVMRVSVFDLSRGARQGIWQEVLRGEDEKGLEQAMYRMVMGFAPTPLGPKPWFTRWWVWTAAGAVVAGAIITAVLATRSIGPEPDAVIIPPGP